MFYMWRKYLQMPLKMNPLMLLYLISAFAASIILISPWPLIIFCFVISAACLFGTPLVLWSRSNNKQHKFCKSVEIHSPAYLENLRAQAIEHQINDALAGFWCKFNEMAERAATSEDCKSRQFDALHLKCRIVFDAVVALIKPKLEEKGFSILVVEMGMWNHIMVSWDAPRTET